VQLNRVGPSESGTLSIPRCQCLGSLRQDRVAVPRRNNANHTKMPVLTVWPPSVSQLRPGSLHPVVPPDFGDIWLQERRTPVLQMPSAIVAESSNLVLNPLHSDAKSIRMVEQRLFYFDRRLWASS